MALFYHLHTQLDLDNKSVNDLTQQEIIRFEKKLKAEVKLGADLDLNVVEKLIYVLKNHLAEIKELYHPNYRILRSILLEDKGFVIPESATTTTFYPSDELRSFIETYLSDALNDYAARCMQQDHYNALLYFLMFKELLAPETKQDIAEKLCQKIDFMTECITISSSNLDNKLTPAFNPKFFQCLNALGPVLFENSIIDLYNACVNKLQKVNRNYFFSVLYALGFYQPIRSDLVQLFSENQKLAYSNGARERRYIKSEKNQKGGTYIQQSYSSSSKSSSSASVGLRGFGVVVVVILIILRIVVYTSRNSSNNYSWNDTKITGTYSLDNEEVVYKDSIAYDMNYIFTQLCCEEIEIIESETAEFNDEGSIYKNIEECDFSNMSVDIYNKTSQSMMLLFETKKALYLKPDEHKRIQLIHDQFAIYTGKNFEQITYVDAYGGVVFEQVFTEMTDAEKAILGRIYQLRNFRLTDGYRLEIGIEDSTVAFDITKTFQLGGFQP